MHHRWWKLRVIRFTGDSSDLSYRAQLKNWEFKYLENVVTPLNFPAIISAARSQQFRWNRVENFSKNAST
jgi:hypothetical protein